MTSDLRFQQSALRLITAKGKTVTYSTVSRNAYNPAVGGAPAVVTPYIIKAVVSNPKGADLEVGTLIERNSKQLLIAALAVSFTPAPNDAVTLDGNSYLVESANVNYAGELPVTHTVFIRKA